MSMYRTTRRRADRGRPCRRIGSYAAAASLAATLAACGDGSSDSANGLIGSLGRIEATEHTRRYIEFANTDLLEDVSGGSFSWTWSSLDDWATSSVGPYRERLSSVLGVDLPSSDTVLTVGESSQALVLVQGGQEGDDIVSTATGSGWSGSDVLAAEDTPTEPLTRYVTKVKASDGDAVLGGPDADMSVLDPSGPSLADDPLLSSLTSCLGDVVAALVVTDERAPLPVAAGVRHDDENPDAPVSVVCVKADSASAAQALVATVEDAVANGKIPDTDKAYSTLFESATVEALDEESITRLTATNTPEAFAHTIFQMTLAGRLPGVSLPRQAEV